MVRKFVLATALVSAASMAAAHDGAHDPKVKAWMDAMSEIGAQMKRMGDMAREKAPFDAAAAREAAALVADRAEAIPVLFADPASDPESEARAAIWDRFDDFEKQAAGLHDAAAEAADAIGTPGDLATALREMGATCKSCHQAYRD